MTTKQSYKKVPAISILIYTKWTKSSDSDSKYYKPKRRNYDKNVITFTSYYIHEFWEICLQIGFKPLSIILEPQTHYAYYFLKKEIKI